jgi:hypothetical protein
MSNNKYLLVLERSEGNLSASKDGDKYVLEGTFTEIGVKNKNNRIYDEKELMPHIKELQEKLKGNKLLGELDHPKSFDISLKNASHVIEDIAYDPQTKKVSGRIRLLNTDAGKQAMALVDAGVPLHISSRAAGVVESNGHVKIKKMFTYDLVADPGFANAELKRVNESFGFGDDALVSIYEMDEVPHITESSEDTYTEENKPTNIETKINEMDSKKYITVEDFNEYSKIVKNEVENLKKALAEANTAKESSSVNEGLVRYAEETAKRVNNIQEYVGKLAESVDGLISHNDYIIENLEKVKNYAELVGERSNQGINYSEKLAESVDHLIEYTKVVAKKADEGIEYTKVVAEKADQGIEFAKYIAEETSNRWNYQSHINEQLDNVISHNDYIVEGTSSIIEYTEYLKEQTENLTGYLNHIVKEINEGKVEIKATPVNEGSNNTASSTEDNADVKINEGAGNYEKSLTDKLNAILESAKTANELAKSDKLHFLNFLSESKRNQFASLTPEKKDEVINAFSTNKYYGSVDAEKLYESVFVVAQPTFNWLTNMPAKYRESWNGLNESQKNAIKAQASLRVLDNQYKIDDFWSSRDLRPSKVEAPLNENVAPITESSKYETPASYMETVEAELKRRFKR